jgi:Helix-turn-helix domain
MLVRYRYRIDPTPSQRQALARAFGCARVVYNDGIALAFRVLTDAVYKGAWQTLEVLPLAVWASGTGVLLWGRRRLLSGLFAAYMVWLALLLLRQAPL